MGDTRRGGLSRGADGRCCWRGSSAEKGCRSEGLAAWRRAGWGPCIGACIGTYIDACIGAGKGLLGQPYEAGVDSTT